MGHLYHGYLSHNQMVGLWMLVTMGIQEEWIDVPGLAFDDHTTKMPWFDHPYIVVI